jgi:hypothetical protein
MKTRTIVSTEKKPARKPAANGHKRTTARRLPPTFEQIAVRAYEIWEARAGGPGTEVEDWLLAERELSRPGTKKSA